MFTVGIHGTIFSGRWYWHVMLVTSMYVMAARSLCLGLDGLRNVNGTMDAAMSGMSLSGGDGFLACSGWKTFSLMSHWKGWIAGRHARIESARARSREMAWDRMQIEKTGSRSDRP